MSGPTRFIIPLSFNFFIWYLTPSSLNFNNVAKSLLDNLGFAFNNSINLSWVVFWVVPSCPWVVFWVVLSISWIVFVKPLLSKGITTFINLPSNIYDSSPYAFVTVGSPWPLSSTKPHVLNISNNLLFTGLPINNNITI